MPTPIGKITAIVTQMEDTTSFRNAYTDIREKPKSMSAAYSPNIGAVSSSVFPG